MEKYGRSDVLNAKGSIKKEKNVKLLKIVSEKFSE